MKTIFTNFFASKTSPTSTPGSWKPWPLLVAACLALATGVAEAQAPKTKPAPFRPRPTAPGNENVFQKHDLQIQFASGTLAGNTYHVGGTIRNIGQASSPANRQVLLYVRSSDDTRWMYANVYRAVPSLKPGQTWTIPGFAIQARNVPTNRFKLVIHTPPGAPARDVDANPRNDERIFDASLVR